MQPTNKSEGIEHLITQFTGKDRVATITAGGCMTCDEVNAVDTLRDELSKREYRISGMCQKCQAEVFGTDE